MSNDSFRTFSTNGENLFNQLSDDDELENDEKFQDENNLSPELEAAKLFISKNKIDRVEASLNLGHGFFKTQKSSSERNAKNNKISFIENFGIDFQLPSQYVINSLINSQQPSFNL